MGLFPNIIVPVFFVYGLAFYTMGIALAFDTGSRIIDERVRRAMMALAVFGLVHGLHEWFEMFVKIADAYGGFHTFRFLEVARTAVLAASFVVLVYFGFDMAHVRTGRGRPWVGALVLAGLFLAGVAALAAWLRPDWDAVVHAADAWARYALGIPGAVLGGHGLILRARECRSQELKPVATGWLIAGIALVLYGLIGQSTPSPSRLFPSTVYNTEVFQSALGFPVQLLRAACAAAATGGLLVALRALEMVQRRAYHTANQARVDAEARTRDEIARRERLQTELLRRTVTAQEEERARISRELHDQTGQTLTALSYRVAALETMSVEECGVTPQMVRDLRQLTDQALADLRQLVTDLRPAQLDDLGLVAGLHWLVDDVRRRLGLHVSLELEGQRTRLPGEVETALFRIAQEALTNVSRHAGVDTARVRLVFGDQNITLEVIDEGRSFSVPAVLNSDPDRMGGWGMMSMQERALAVGGRLHLSSEKGKGTVVCAMIPVIKEYADA
jgi:signal transduction histidine kinase